MTIGKQEFLDSIKIGTAVKNWASLNKADIKQQLDSNAAAMQDFEQRNPHHCFKLLEHCLQTCDALENHSGRDAIVRTAAFFHDLGKPIVAKEKQGRLVFYGHAYVSAKLAKPLLQKMGFDKHESLDILFLISHHDDFISYVLEDKNIPGKGKIMICDESVSKYYIELKKKYNYIGAAHFNELLRELVDLMIADSKAQSEYVYIQDKLVDSREDKVKRLEEIKKILMKIDF